MVSLPGRKTVFKIAYSAERCKVLPKEFRRKRKNTLQKQGGCGSIGTEGTPTNGASPFNSGNYSVVFGERVGRSNFLFLQELQSLVVLINEDNKCNGFDDHQCKSKKVLISNHFTTPFA